MVSVPHLACRSGPIMYLTHQLGTFRYGQVCEWLFIQFSFHGDQRRYSSCFRILVNICDARILIEVWHADITKACSCAFLSLQLQILLDLLEVSYRVMLIWLSCQTCERLPHLFHPESLWVGRRLMLRHRLTISLLKIIVHFEWHIVVLGHRSSLLHACSSVWVVAHPRCVQFQVVWFNVILQLVVEPIETIDIDAGLVQIGLLHNALIQAWPHSSRA